MSTTEDQNHDLEDKTPAAKPGVYSPVSVQTGEAVGVVFLGLIALLLLIALLKAEARYRVLLAAQHQA